MEMFGIMLSAPFLLVASTIYALLIGKVTDRWGVLSGPLLLASGTIICMFGGEVLGVVFLGAVRLREAIGEPYYPAHELLFALIIPSIVNVMRIQKRVVFVSKWYVIGPVCGFLGFFIVAFQYLVSEALFGVNGISGPYSPS